MIQRTGKSNTAVVGWGRGMGHSGHMMLASSVLTHSKDVKGDPYFFVSKTVGKDDPIYPEEKLAIYKKVFPKAAKVFQQATDAMPNITNVLGELTKMGYKNAVVVLGKDQVNSFQFLAKPDKSGVPVYKNLGLDNIQIISRQQTNDPSRNEEGPRATPMREILLNPNASQQEKFKVWRDAMSPAINDREVLDLMQKAETRMKAMSTKTKKLKEFVSKVRPLLKEASIQKKYQLLKLIKEATDKMYEVADEVTETNKVLFTDPNQKVDVFIKRLSNPNEIKKIASGLAYEKIDAFVDFATQKYGINPSDIVWTPTPKNVSESVDYIEEK
jgi:cell fate (sporulation/competence/biofilm development) regulator YmcA (YheA/YmcA/DUF963 family)